MVSQDKTKLVESVREGNIITLHLSGDWSLKTSKPEFNTIVEAFPQDKDIRGIKFDVTQLITWESSLMSFFLNIINFGKVRGLVIYID